jgi:hypothetical protein
VFQSDWQRQEAALQALRLSRTTFWRLRREGVIRPVHLFRAGIGSRAPLMINVPAVMLALRVHSIAKHGEPARYPAG